VRFPSAEDADGLQASTELPALGVAGGASAATVVVGGLFGLAVACERLELVDVPEAAVCWLATPGAVCRP
jgi:hypothetical protein